MKVSEFRRHLQSAPNDELCFVLPSGERIPAHAHITEVGRTDRRFIDCGGTIRSLSSCTLQAWVASDEDHRLLPGGLVGILRKAAPVLGTDELDVEIEYEDGLLSQFPVVSGRAEDGRVVFELGVKHTDCLAKELCTPALAEASAGCCTTSEEGGCC